MKLKFYINSSGEKIYTLKENIDGKETKNAHYKFIKIRDAPRSDVRIVRGN
jgi:hypothetical protein